MKPAQLDRDRLTIPYLYTRTVYGLPELLLHTTQSPALVIAREPQRMGLKQLNVLHD